LPNVINRLRRKAVHAIHKISADGRSVTRDYTATATTRKRVAKPGVSLRGYKLHLLSSV